MNILSNLPPEILMDKIHTGSVRFGNEDDMSIRTSGLLHMLTT